MICHYVEHKIYLCRNCLNSRLTRQHHWKYSNDSAYAVDSRYISELGKLKNDSTAISPFIRSVISYIWIPLLWNAQTNFIHCYSFHLIHFIFSIYLIRDIQVTKSRFSRPDQQQSRKKKLRLSLSQNTFFISKTILYIQTNCIS